MYLADTESSQQINGGTRDLSFENVFVDVCVFCNFIGC